MPKRVASAPYFAITSIGSIALPRLFDILRPRRSKTSGVMKTSRNGMSRANFRPNINIRGPPEDRERPEATRKPGVERIGVAREFGDAVLALGECVGFLFRFGDDRFA